MLVSNDKDMVILGAQLAFEESEEWRRRNIPYDERADNAVKHGRVMESEYFRSNKSDNIILFGDRFIHYRHHRVFPQLESYTEIKI